MGGREIMRDDCVFCDRIKRGEYDYDDKWSVAFRPLHPVTPGHFLVVPRKHVSHALESPRSAGKALDMAWRPGQPD